MNRLSVAREQVFNAHTSQLARELASDCCGCCCRCRRRHLRHHVRSIRLTWSYFVNVCSCVCLLNKSGITKIKIKKTVIIMNGRFGTVFMINCVSFSFVIDLYYCFSRSQRIFGERDFRNCTHHNDQYKSTSIQISSKTQAMTHRI